MKRCIFGLVLALGLGLVLVGRADDDEKPKKPTFHATVFVAGLNDSIELDDVLKPDLSMPNVLIGSDGSMLYVPHDKVLAVLLEPMGKKKRAQEDKQPK